MIEADATIAVRDGARIGARVYRPEGSGPYPALLAASSRLRRLEFVRSASKPAFVATR